MENNRKRILNLVKNNIVNKLKGRGGSLEDKEQLLERELLRNSSLFMNKDKNKEIIEEEIDFIVSILKELDWSVLVAEERLERLVELRDSEETNTTNKERYKISEAKMKKFLSQHEKSLLDISNEVKSILKQDYENRAYLDLHERLFEMESAKGSKWSKEEIDYVIDKRDKGHSFRAIATILKRPERVVYLKYHENK